MDNATLRRACEVAGLEVRPHAIHDGWEAGQHVPGAVWWYEDEDPALPAYVASLLVAKVRERAHGWDGLSEADAHMQAEGVYTLSTDEQRIAAALEVLE